jgi:signal transduction histidine kinase
MPQVRNLYSSVQLVPPRVIGGFALAVITLLITSLVTLQALSRRKLAVLSVERSVAVLRTTEALVAEVNDSQLAITEFILTGDRQLLEPYESARRSIPETLTKLRTLTADRPQVQEELDRIGPVLGAAMELDRQELVARRSGASVPELRPLLMDGKALLDQSAAQLDRLRTHTASVLENEQRALSESMRSSTFVVVLGDAILLTLILAAATVAFRDAASKARAVQFQRRVLGMVGHDLRNPLSVVTMSATHLAMSPDLGDRVRGSISKIIHAANRMEKLIRQLLDYSRIELRIGFPLDIRPSDVGASCSRVIEQFRALNPTREIRYEPGERFEVCWDPDRIEQVLENLVGNALKYSPPNTTVRLAWKKEGDDVVIRVNNSGAPIPEDVLPHIFEPFRRGKNQEVGASKDSLGLGLYIVRQIIIQHGGKVDVQSAPLEGTTFTVRLPRSMSAPAAA